MLWAENSELVLQCYSHQRVSGDWAPSNSIPVCSVVTYRSLEGKKVLPWRKGGFDHSVSRILVISVWAKESALRKSDKWTARDWGVIEARVFLMRTSFTGRFFRISSSEFDFLATKVICASECMYYFNWRENRRTTKACFTTHALSTRQSERATLRITQNLITEVLLRSFW